MTIDSPAGDMIFNAPNPDDDSAEFTDACSRAFLQYGAVVINNVFSPDYIESIKSAYQAGYGGTVDKYREVGDKRTMLAIDIKPPFSDPALFAPDAVFTVIQRLLGKTFVLDSYVAVTSRPDSEDQHVHVDFPYLFEEDEQISLAAPPYAITLAIPLIPLSAMSGVTRVWPGTHRHSPDANDPALDLMRSISVIPEPGGCYLFDARLYHGGTANYSEEERPILYIIYCRPWWRDAKNFSNQKPLRINEQNLAALPTELQAVFRYVR